MRKRKKVSEMEGHEEEIGVRRQHTVGSRKNSHQPSVNRERRQGEADVNDSHE